MMDLQKKKTGILFRLRLHRVTLHNKKYLTIWAKECWRTHSKASIVPSLLMVKLARENPIQWLVMVWTSIILYDTRFYLIKFGSSIWINRGIVPITCEVLFERIGKSPDNVIEFKSDFNPIRLFLYSSWL